MEGLGADEARLALRVVRAFLDRDRDGLLVFFVGIVLFCVAAAVDSFTNLLVAAAPVVMLASFVAVPCVASNATRRVVGQWRGAGGAVCEDHFGLAPRRLRVGRVNGGSFFVASVLLPLAGNFVAFAPASTRAIIRRNQASQASARLRIRARHQLAQIVGIITHRCCP